MIQFLVIGYQRLEVPSHAAESREYLESDNPMRPNAVVIAFDPTVRFEPLAVCRCRSSST